MKLRWVQNFLRFLSEHNYRTYRAQAASNAETFLTYLNNMYDGEGVFWRLNHGIKSDKYKDDPHLMYFDQWIMLIELRAVRDDGRKFETSKYHDFQFHHRVNTMSKALYNQCVELIVMFWCEGPIPTETSQKITDNMNYLITLLRESCESKEELVRFEVLYNMAVDKITKGRIIAGAEINNIKPEQLCRLWLWLLTELHSTINRVVKAKFVLK